MPRNRPADRDEPNGGRTRDELLRDELVREDTVRESIAAESFTEPFAATAAWRDPRFRSRLRRRLITWFDANARDLPWRSTDDAYLIWVSEVMLQQTQVATVIPYFERFRKTFPSPGRLAAADEADVLRLWEGLGYYRRARQLHAAAQQIVSTHGGQFPTTFQEVLALPGIGRYTAGAILSIAHDQRHPIVEANTQRLYSRLIGLRRPPAEKRANQLLWEFAAAILPRKAVGRFNQALMELGALVCLPRQPKCEACPLRSLCAAHRHGWETAIPGKVKNIVYENRTEFALLIRDTVPRGEREPSYFVYQVPEGQRWGGLWDFPRYGGSDAENPQQAAERVWADFGIRVELGRRMTTIRHGVTRYRITLEAYHALCGDFAKGDRRRGSAEESPRAPGTSRWLTAAELAELPLNVTGRQLADRLADASNEAGKNE